MVKTLPADELAEGKRVCKLADEYWLHGVPADASHWEAFGELMGGIKALEEKHGKEKFGNAMATLKTVYTAIELA